MRAVPKWSGRFRVGKFGFLGEGGLRFWIGGFFGLKVIRGFESVFGVRV